MKNSNLSSLDYSAECFIARLDLSVQELIALKKDDIIELEEITNLADFHVNGEFLCRCEMYLDGKILKAKICDTDCI